LKKKSVIASISKYLYFDRHFPPKLPYLMGGSGPI